MASSSSGAKSDLYRWKRWTKDKPAAAPAPRKKPSHTNDVQDWIKKVEAASDQAAAITFGLDKPRRHDNVLSGHDSAMAKLDVLQDHNEAYTEAQDLLSHWMAEKINIEDDTDNAIFYDEEDTISPPSRSRKTDLKDQWDSMLEENAPGMLDPYNKVSSEDMFYEIENRDDNLTVESILQGMLDKDIVQKSFKKDLGLEADKKKKNPTVTMDARQKKVKENREKRQQEKEQQLRRRQNQKDTQLQARQIVMKEERQRVLQRQREEALMQQEMAKIRKEMQGQRQAVEETRKRQKDLEEAEREKMRLEEELNHKAEAEVRMQAEKLLEEEKQELLERAQELKVLKAGEDLKCLQRHFQAWFQLVVHHRLKMGKARAVSDWRCLVRSWNAWKAYVRACRAEREAKEAEMFVKDSHRKKQMAETHNRQRMLRKYFLAWQNWIKREHQQQSLFDNQEKTKSKMAAFLEAASTGKLWTNRNEDGIEGVADEARKDKHAHRSGAKTQQQVDDLFAQPARRQASTSSVQSTSRSNTSSQESGSARSQHSTGSSAHSQRSTGSPSKPGVPSKPKFAWQVQRQHVHNMKAEEIANLGADGSNRNQNNSGGAWSPRPSSEVSTDRSSKRSVQYKANNFENRYAAQQKILHDQQQQLRDQQRLIEGLQIAQKQALFQHQLANIRDGKGGGQPSDLGHGGEGDGLVSERSTGERSSARSEPESSAISTARSDETESSSVSQQSTTLKAPALKGMDERAARRAKLKAEREEKQRKKEDEKLAKIKEEEEKRIAAEEAEKKAKIEKRKEEKRLFKQRELEKQQRLQHIAKQNIKAEEHYRQSLMKNYGLRPWKKLVLISHQNMTVAEDHHSNLLLRECVLSWHRYTQETKRGKCQVAEDQYQYMLVRKCFSSWKKFGHYQSILLQKARRHYIISMKQTIFSSWQDYVTNERLERWRREELATQHNITRIMRKGFNGLRRYPKMLKEDRERERRREEMRKKVASIIPDFGLG